MKKLFLYVVPVALVAAHASAAPSSGWGGMAAPILLLGLVPERARLWYWCSVVAVAAVAAASTAATSTGPTSTRAISTAPTFNATYRPTVTSRRTAT